MAGDRVALDHLARRRPQGADLGDEVGEHVGRQEIALDDKAVAVELPRDRPGIEPRQPAPAPLRARRCAMRARAVCRPRSLSQRLPITGLRAKNFSWVNDLGEPERHQQGLTRAATALRSDPPNPGR